MTTKSNVAVADKPKTRVRKKPVAKKTTSPKKTTTAKKTQPAKVEPQIENGDLKKTKETAGDLTKVVRWTKLKRAIITTMKGLGATKAASAVTAAEIVKASKGELNERQVISQCQSKYDLVVFSFVKQHKTEGGAMTYSLTAKGKNLKF